jgi:long-subunit acyl-CoA synthetase (AMP-forming)
MRSGSCGKTYPGTQIRLIAGSNEVILFGRNVFMGYLNDAVATSEAVDDRGWLHTFVLLYSLHTYLDTWLT